MNNDKNQKLDGFTIGILILAAFGLIIMIAEISEAIDETKKERAYWDNWRYEHIQKGADEYNRNHSGSTYTNTSSSSRKTATSSSSFNNSSTTKTTTSSVSSNNNTTKRKSSSKTDYSTKTVDPSDHDIDTYCQPPIT